MLIAGNQAIESQSSFKPFFFRTSMQAEKEGLTNLLNDNQGIEVIDQIDSQLVELIKSKHPSRKLSIDELTFLKEAHTAARPLDEYGVWVYYPWSKKLIHLLDEEEFVKVRTNRNQNKITADEQARLNQKKIGIVGLSVGQSIALTLAMERTCGELRLADFDTAELSNLNRLRTGVQNLGLKKTVIAAREIAEIDPYLKVTIFNDGLSKENMDEFFLEGGRLDLFVEVCDGLDIKIESRFKARELGIPVVMDTNDRGMLDVERFDLEPQRPILHGFVEGLNPDNIKNLTNEQKIPHILKIVGAEEISTRLKASMIEVEQSINTWPQLASSVVLGGALTTDVARRILLDQYHDSGRYYVDLDRLVANKSVPSASSEEVSTSYLPPPELSTEEMVAISSGFDGYTKTGVALTEEEATDIVSAGIMAPSGGNAQPWKFLYKTNQLYIFHDAHFSYSLLDYANLGSYVAIGAAIENISIKASSMGLNVHAEYFPSEQHPELVAVLEFERTKLPDYESFLEKGIGIRLTNRTIGSKQTLPETVYQELERSIRQYEGSSLHFIDDDQTMKELGDLLATTEMLRIIHPRGHYDTFTNELRWTPEENAVKRDGLDTRTLGATASEVAALKIASDAKAIELVRDLRGGHAFKKSVHKSIAASSAIGILTMPEFSALNFLKGGRALERVWIEANLKNIGFQPISQLVFMLARLKHGQGEGMDNYYRQQFDSLDKRFTELVPDLSGQQPIFIFRLFEAEKPEILSLRRPIKSSFVYLNKM